jgi:hypothetical protein
MGTSRSTLKNRDTAVLSGIDKHITGPLRIGGKTYTPGELKAAFQAEITVLLTADAQRKTLLDTILAAKAAQKRTLNLYQLLRSSLIGQYGKTAHAVLNDFGMNAPKVPGPKRVDVKVAAQAKRQATRTARHTTGSKQKKAVKGDVTGVTMTPIVASQPVAEGADRARVHDAGRAVESPASP